MEEKKSISNWLIITYVIGILVLFFLGIGEAVWNCFKDSNQPESVSFFQSGKEKAQSHKYKEAIIDYDKAISLEIKNAEYYYERGLSKWELKYYKAAIKDYDKAIQLKPSESEYIYTRAITKIELKDYVGAIEDYNKLLHLFPKASDFYRERGFAKSKINDFEGSSKDYVKADELETVLSSDNEDE